MRATNELRERGVRHLLDAAVAAGARRFVSESFFGVYGFGPYERPRTEDDPIGRERNRGVQAIIDAIAVLRGPGPRRQRRAAHRGRLAALRRLPRPAGAEHGRHGRARAQAPAAGHRRPRRDDADVELGDAARAVADALERAPAGRIYNVADDEPVAMDDYLGELARVVGAPPPRHVPYWLVRVAAPYMATFMGRAGVPMSNARIADELGWRPRTRPTARRSPCSIPPSTQPPKRPRRARTLAT